VGLQGTFSLWESASALKEFASAEAHAAVVARTEPERWYAEELFARFAVVGSRGTLDGRDPTA
jgi:heme-degrading monooxygenase HmoA